MATVLLECNGCGVRRQGDHAQTTDQLRDALGRVGWISDKANDRDACPGCLAQGRMVAARG